MVIMWSFITWGRTLAAVSTKNSRSFGYHSNKPSDGAISNANVQPVSNQTCDIWEITKGSVCEWNETRPSHCQYRSNWQKTQITADQLSSSWHYGQQSPVSCLYHCTALLIILLWQPGTMYYIQPSSLWRLHHSHVYYNCIHILLGFCDGDLIYS